MDWKKERDELIAQTLAFVQSVATHLPDPLPDMAALQRPKAELRLPPIPLTKHQPATSAVKSAPVPSVRPGAMPPTALPSALPTALPNALPTAFPGAPPMPSVRPSAPAPHLPLPRPGACSEVEQEVRTRIASFRVHQERFKQERAEYFSATIARLRATLQDAPPLHTARIAQPREPLNPKSSPGPAANISETPQGSRSSESAPGRS
jgi:hypothetical protein